MRTTRSTASTSTARSTCSWPTPARPAVFPSAANGQLYAVSEPDGQDHALRRGGQGQPGCRRHSRSVYSRHARRRPLRHQRRREARRPGSGLVRQRRQENAGRRGPEIRHRAWPTAPTSGCCPWPMDIRSGFTAIRSIADGTLTNKERFFWLHVADWDDDAGAESVCYCQGRPDVRGHAIAASRSAPTTARRR